MRRVVPAIWLACAVAACGDDGGQPHQACEASGCHGQTGSATGIEVAHAGSPLACTDCHGGDGDATDQQVAHVAPAPQWVADRDGYLRNLSMNELDQVDPDYLRFANPGDYRVAATGCGASNARAGTTGCHQSLVDSTQRSVMATFAGHFNVPRFQAGQQDRPALFGATDVADLDYPSPPPPGTVPSLVQAVIPADDAPRDTVDTEMDHYLPKNCTHCHQGNFGRNDARGNFRSSGCTACHMLYNDDGISQSSDPVAVREQPPHPQNHQLTLNIGENQCEHCHYQGARIGLLYRGVVEWGFSTPPPFPNIGESLHNHPPEFYLDAKSDPSHPPDLHWTAGMACADCHVGRDVHGDGRIYSTAKFQVSVRCENCHGNVDQAITEGRATAGVSRGGAADPECFSGDVGGDYFLNCNGDPFKNIFRDDEGVIWMRPAKDREDLLRVNQIKDMLDQQLSANMTEAMGRDPDTGFSHTEVIECDGCHTAYREYCFGCHVTMDYSQTKADLLTGQRTIGAEVTFRQDYSLDLYFLGTDRRGKIRSFCPSLQVFLTAVDKDAQDQYVTLFETRVRTTATGKVGFHWATDMPHITSALPQNCTTCHADQDNACDDSAARQTYGYGTGRFMFTDEDSVTYDLTQLLDANGDPLYDFSHEGQGAVAKSVRENALSICVQDHAR